MNRTIHLAKEPVLRLDDLTPIALLKNEALNIEFDTFYNLSEAFATFTNEKEKAIVRITEAKAAVPQRLLFAGNLVISVDIYCGGEKIKHFDGLPMKIEEAPTEEKTLKIYDILNDLENRLAEVEKRTKIIL